MLEIEKNESEKRVKVEYRYDTNSLYGKILGNGFIFASLLLAVVVIRSNDYNGLILAGAVWIIGLLILNMEKYYKETFIKMVITEQSLTYSIIRNNEAIKKFEIMLKDIEDIYLKYRKIFSPGKQNGIFRWHKASYSFAVFSGGRLFELFRDSNFNDHLHYTVDLKNLFELTTGQEVKILDKDVDKELLQQLNAFEV